MIDYPEGMEEEFLNDFVTAVKQINFKNYNPSSNEFISTVMTGLMWHLVNETREQKTKIMGEQHDEIKDELMGAEKYWQKFIETNDSTYKQMANDEIRHADFLIKKQYNNVSDEKEKQKLNTYSEWQKQIISRLSTR